MRFTKGDHKMFAQILENCRVEEEKENHFKFTGSIPRSQDIISVKANSDTNLGRKLADWFFNGTPDKVRLYANESGVYNIQPTIL